MQTVLCPHCRQPLAIVTPDGVAAIRQRAASTNPRARTQGPTAKERIIEYVRENGPTSAIALAEAINTSRTTVTNTLSDRDTFVSVGRSGKQVFYDLTQSVSNG